MTVTVRAPAKINLALMRRPRPPPTATTRWPRSTRRSRCTTRSRPARPTPASSRSAVTGEGEDVVPLDDTNLAVRAARLLAKRFDVDRGRGAQHPQDDRGGRGTGRRQRGRGRRAASPATRSGGPGPPATSCSRWRASSAATCRSAWSAATRSAAAAASWSRRCWPAARTSGCSRTPTAGLSTPRGLRRVRPDRGRGDDAADAETSPCPRTLMAALRTGDPYDVGRGAAQRPAGRRDPAAAVDPRRTWPSARSSARSARSSRAPARPACSWPPTPTTRSTWPWRCPARARAGSSSGPNGPVHGARLIT